MEQFENHNRQDGKVEEGRGDWCWVKKDEKWEAELLPVLPTFDHAERERRGANHLQMLHETAAQWKLDDRTVEQNEGFLRNHPRYHGLFLKWVTRYLQMKGFDKEKFSGKFDDDGQMLRPDGKVAGRYLPNVIANGREWIDENIETELRISEGFVDITHDYPRREKLGIEPKNVGWWTQDEV